MHAVISSSGYSACPSIAPGRATMSQLVELLPMSPFSDPIATEAIRNTLALYAFAVDSRNVSRIPSVERNCYVFAYVTDYLIFMPARIFPYFFGSISSKQITNITASVGSTIPSLRSQRPSKLFRAHGCPIRSTKHQQHPLSRSPPILGNTA